MKVLLIEVQDEVPLKQSNNKETIILYV